MTSRRTRSNRRDSGQAGFSLLEVIVAALVLSISLLTMAYAYAQGMALVSSTQEESIARQKAREALESVVAARNDQALTFAQIANVSNGGVFLDGFTPLTTDGADGLPNTADDGAIETIIEPGPDGILGTGDDVNVPLTQFQREIAIKNVGSGKEELKQITVTIQYTTQRNLQRQVSVTTYVSAYI